MSMFTLLSFAAHLGAIEADLKLAGEGIIAKWCMAVRDAIGTYWRMALCIRQGALAGGDAHWLYNRHGQALRDFRRPLAVVQRNLLTFPRCASSSSSRLGRRYHRRELKTAILRRPQALARHAHRRH